jgi:hypothetical protein
VSQWWLAVVRLTGLFVGVGLATSRIGLIVHELAGHGGAAVAFGGEVSDFRLFWFAGGWIRYHFEDPTPGAMLVISLAGLIIEAVIGVALWLLLSAKDSIARRLARGVGGALVIHAGWYFATGTWHGYGDGLLTYRAVGDWRYPIAIATGLVTCGVAFVVARLLLGTLAAAVPGGRWRRIAGLVTAAVLAGTLQVGLALGEVRIRGDATYGAIMKPQGDRMTARELAAWQREQARRGVQVTEAERAEQQRRLAARHREPPFAPILALALAVAIAFGASRARLAIDPARAGGDPLTTRLVAIVGAIAVGSILAVMTIEAVFH